MSPLRFPFALLAASLVLIGAAHRTPTVFDLSDSVGRRVPPVTVMRSDGNPLALTTLQGRPAYVFLFASWCEPCRLAFPFVRDAYAKYGERVRFIGVDVLEDEDAARAAIAREAFPFPVAIYPIAALDAVIAPAAQIQAGAKYRIPADFLLDAAGIVRYAWHGVPVDEAGTPVDVLPDYLAKLGVR